MTTDNTRPLPAASVPSEQFHLPSVGRHIPWDDALAAVLGYARATRPLALDAKGSLPAAVVDVPAFAFRAYDCVPPSAEAGFTWLDVLVVDSLNGKLRHPTITALKDAADRAWEHVAEAVRLADGRPFWGLPSEEAGRYPTPGSTGAALNRAWEELMRTDGVAVALTHKLLHHKKPDLFPLLDGKTKPLLHKHMDETAGMWAVVHRELNANDDQFTALEKTVASLLDREDDVELHRLRLHDILLWLTATKKWDFALSSGHATPEWSRFTG